MNLTLRNTDYRDDGIFGELIDDQGQHFCYTLQHAYDSDNGDGSYLPKVLPGTYKCVRGQHQLAHMDKPFLTFEITGVSGHTNILFHKGNYNDDSEGCVLLGTSITKAGSWMLSSSAPMFNKFMQLQNNINEFTLTVENK